MPSKLDIVGTYVYHGYRLTSPDKPFYLVLDQRRPGKSGLKPPQFLIAKPTGEPFDTGTTYQYVSSVYPVKGVQFSRIEYDGIQYTFKLTDSTATIQLWTPTDRPHSQDYSRRPDLNPDLDNQVHNNVD